MHGARLSITLTVAYALAGCGGLRVAAGPVFDVVTGGVGGEVSVSVQLAVGSRTTRTSLGIAPLVGVGAGGGVSPTVIAGERMSIEQAWLLWRHDLTVRLAVTWGAAYGVPGNGFFGGELGVGTILLHDRLPAPPDRQLPRPARTLLESPWGRVIAAGIALRTETTWSWQVRVSPQLYWEVFGSLVH